MTDKDPVVLLSINVVVDHDLGPIVQLSVHDKHLVDCPACLAIHALRISNTFLHAIDQLEHEADDEKPDRVKRKPSRGLH